MRKKGGVLALLEASGVSLHQPVHQDNSGQHFPAALVASPISKTRRSSRKLSTKCQRVGVTHMRARTINNWFRCRGSEELVTNGLCFFYSRRKINL